MPSERRVMLMSVFEALYLCMTFGLFIVAILTYVKK
ncbi:MAG: putative holin-like toxin [Mogibacterium sp.]|nr:putative holin-like toxin [Mogibacterium sp.]